jgi:hypothetical protein
LKDRSARVSARAEHNRKRIENMASIPTVKIKSGDDYALINESDFDPETMELYEEPAPKKTKPKAKPKAK